MTRFYEKLLRTKDIRKSFNEAQSEMRSVARDRSRNAERKKYDPYFWGAFVLIE